MAGKRKKGGRPTAVGCYIFAGGFTVGVRKHFDVLAHLEDGPYGTATAAHNIPELRGNIHMQPDAWPLADLAGRVDFVYGNPPCAPWSRASEGRAVPWNLDPRLDCIRRLYHVLEAVEPDVWAWESVRGAWTRGRPLVDTIAAAAAARGYSATALLVEGTRHGLPQRRLRVFLVLHRLAIDWQPTKFRKVVTVGDALARKFKTSTGRNLPHGYDVLLAKMTDDDGIELRNTFERLNKKKIARAKAAGQKVHGRPAFMNRRLRADRPSLVLTGGANQFHPKEPRFITVEESAALCGYPPSFRFIGATSRQYAQVAQAVTPPVGEYLARMVAGAVTDSVKLTKPVFEQVEIFTDRVERLVLPPVTDTGFQLKVGAPVKALRPVSKAPAGRPSPRSPVAREPRRGSGYRIREMLKGGVLTTEQILDVIHKEFPDSKAKASDVYWNKRKLAAQGGVP